MEKYLVITIILLIRIFSSYSSIAQVINRSEKIKPQWVNSSAHILQCNNSYEYKMINNEGKSIIKLKNNRLFDLASYLKTTNKVEGEIDWISNTENSDGEFSTSSKHTLSFKTKTSSEQFECKFIDDYWEYVSTKNNGCYYKYYAIYAVSRPEVKPIFDNYELSTYYGAHGLWRSAIVPGWGQMYKGSYLKGGLIMGGAAALAGGTVACCLTRKDYLSKMANTHSANVKQQYAARANNFNTGMYICLGSLVSLYVYNLVDAIVASGGKRIIVYPDVSSEGSIGIGGKLNF